MRFILSMALCLGFATAATAQCAGTDLRDTLTPDERAELDAAVADTPYPNGNHWRATRGDTVIHLIGTVHLDDPRLDGPTNRLRPVIETASALLLEMTPADESDLQQSLLDDPSLLLLADTTLPELMTESAWQALAEASQARGLPGFMAAKFQPWYLSMLLSVPPCATATITEGQGLDKRLSVIAKGADVPMDSLEPYQTIFDKFADTPLDDQIAMLESALIAPEAVEDMFATLLASFIDEATVEGWEISRLLARRATPLAPDEVDAVYKDMEDTLLTERNRAWIPVILNAAGPGHIVVAAGAAHLPGDTGLLKLLADEGFTLDRQPF